MLLTELLHYRKLKLQLLQDDSGFQVEEDFARECLYFLNASKLADSDDFSECYFQSNDADRLKINGYLFNESGERLQLFIVNLPSLKDDEAVISRKEYYEQFFSRTVKFIKKAVKGELDSIHDTEPVKPLINALKSPSKLNDIDVIEVFLLSATISVESRGASQLLKTFDFQEDEIQVKYKNDTVEDTKRILIKKRVIDFNFLYKVESSGEPREPLEIDFTKYGDPLECLPAATEKTYESFITIIPASILQKLYKDHSSRLLERNVRAFLQFRKGANQNMRNTIKTNPERFLAYNNGLTITATDGRILNEKGKVLIESLYDFQIVNGGQTTASIYFTWKDGAPLDKVKVFAKINIIKGQSVEELEDLIKSISINSNTQTKVTTVDLDSRSPYLRRMKEVSESSIAPDGKRWFFERAKGEYYTKINTSESPKQVERDYPKERVLSKEQIAKYYVAWGDRPHLVKKGGEKVFKDFMLILKDNFPKPENMNSLFYEDLISKVILFRELETIYGARSNAIGQIRSATVPYSIALIWQNTLIEQGSSSFELSHIWRNQKLNPDQLKFYRTLLEIVNKRIVANKFTDDVNEDTKKEEMWKRIKADPEIKAFFSSEYAKGILKKYRLTHKQYKERYKDPYNGSSSIVPTISAEVWFALSNWAKENEIFESKDISFLLQIGKLTKQKREISKKQSKYASDLYIKSLEEGFIAPEVTGLLENY